MNFIFKIGQGLLTWAIGGMLRSYIEEEIKKQAHEITKKMAFNVKSELSSIDDADLRLSASYAVRYVARKFPEISNDEKLQKAISTIQTLTPPGVDFFISDATLREVIENAYREFKAELQTL